MAENQQSNSKVLGVAFVCVFGSSLVWWSMSPSELDVGRATLVTLRSRATNKFVEVSAADGLLRVSANVSGPATRFRMLTVAPSTVARLRQLSLTFERTQVKAGRNGHSMVTRSGCKCSGFSNEHGFGRFCHAWETKWQDKWCPLVRALIDHPCAHPPLWACSTWTPHDQCDRAPSHFRCVEPMPTAEWATRLSGRANLQRRRVARSTAAVRTYPSPAGHTPSPIRCYVEDSCTSRSVKKGSFGRRHDVCTPAPGPSPPPNPPPSPPSPPPPPQPILAPPFDALKAKGKWVPPPVVHAPASPTSTASRFRCWRMLTKPLPVPTGHSAPSGFRGAVCLSSTEMALFATPTGRWPGSRSDRSENSSQNSRSFLPNFPRQRI